MTPGGWERQWRYQLGHCAICDKIATPRYRRFSADVTGHLVCRKCWWGRGNATGPPGPYWQPVKPACDHIMERT